MPPAVALLNYKISCNTIAEFFPNWDFCGFSLKRGAAKLLRGVRSAQFGGLMSLKRLVYIQACFHKISLLYTVHLYSIQTMFLMLIK